MKYLGLAFLFAILQFSKNTGITRKKAGASAGFHHASDQDQLAVGAGGATWKL